MARLAAHAGVSRAAFARRFREEVGTSPLSYLREHRFDLAERALVTEPDIILADEPTGNLDSASTEAVLGLLDELHGAGRTIVLITHEHEVAAQAQRNLVIRDGLITDDVLVGAVR